MSLHRILHICSNVRPPTNRAYLTRDGATCNRACCKWSHLEAQVIQLLILVKRCQQELETSSATMWFSTCYILQHAAHTTIWTSYDYEYTFYTHVKQQDHFLTTDPMVSHVIYNHLNHILVMKMPMIVYFDEVCSQCDKHDKIVIGQPITLTSITTVPQYMLITSLLLLKFFNQNQFSTAIFLKTLVKSSLELRIQNIFI